MHFFFLLFKMARWCQVGLKFSWICLQPPHHWGPPGDHDETSHRPGCRIRVARSSSVCYGKPQCSRRCTTSPSPRRSAPQLTGCWSYCVLQPQKPGRPPPQCQRSCVGCAWMARWSICWSGDRKPQQCIGGCSWKYCRQPKSEI